MPNLYLAPSKDLLDHCDTILAEVATDELIHEWWVPKANTHTIFEQALMKFVNGNLDYTDLRNMVIHAHDPNPYWNKAFINTRGVCEKLANQLSLLFPGDIGPFGRMCVWKVPPGHCIEPHTDNYKYHKAIRRWLLFLNLDDSQTYVQFGDDVIRATKGALAELRPAEQQHELANTTSDQFWYFLVFDTWKPSKLSEIPTADLDDWAKNPKRKVYMSEH